MLLKNAHKMNDYEFISRSRARRRGLAEIGNRWVPCRRVYKLDIKCWAFRLAAQHLTLD